VLRPGGGACARLDGDACTRLGLSARACGANQRSCTLRPTDWQAVSCVAIGAVASSGRAPPTLSAPPLSCPSREATPAYGAEEEAHWTPRATTAARRAG
jgi:hypothetical protein